MFYHATFNLYSCSFTFLDWYKDMVSGDEQTLSIICPARSWLTLKKFHKAAKNGNFGENAHAATNLICGTGNSFLAGFRA